MSTIAREFDLYNAETCDCCLSGCLYCFDYDPELEAIHARNEEDDLSTSAALIEDYFARLDAKAAKKLRTRPSSSDYWK